MLCSMSTLMENWEEPNWSFLARLYGNIRKAKRKDVSLCLLSCNFSHLKAGFCSLQNTSGHSLTIRRYWLRIRVRDM